MTDPRDADEAIAQLDGSVVGGRSVEVVRSKQSRKTPREMLTRERDGGGGRGGGGYGECFEWGGAIAIAIAIAWQLALLTATIA